MKKIKVTAVILCSITLSACWYNKKWEDMYPKGQNTSSAACDTIGVISYSVSVQPVIQNLCAIAGCHVSGGSALNYNNFNFFKSDAQSGQVMYRISLPTSNGLHMPQSSSSFVPACDTLKIKKWIKGGCQPN